MQRAASRANDRGAAKGNRMRNITMDTESWIGSVLVDSDNRALGRIDAIYFEAETGTPQWMAVDTGVDGAGHSFVPLADAVPTEDAVMTPYDAEQIDGAPRIEAFEDLPDDEVAELYGYYDLPYAEPVVVDEADLYGSSNTTGVVVPDSQSSRRMA